MWRYTPRRLFMFYELALLRRRRERLEQFNVALVGARGDQNSIAALARNLGGG